MTLPNADEPASLAAPLRSVLAHRLRDHPMVRAAWLFGSRARGTERPDSDVDVAVLIDDARAATPARLKDAIWHLVAVLARDVPSERIDLVILNGAPALLRHRVIRDGVLLTSRSAADRVRFVRQTIRDHQDLEPRLREFTRRRIRRLREDRGDDGRYGDLLAAARRTRRLLAPPERPRSGD
ncbi:MAG: nucleotidyltransferase domain-containing protein [Acidobacteria bacterium]|nr:nucleotidyltransferase domain-containing protein [Acidobacteriota bacterium]